MRSSFPLGLAAAAAGAVLGAIAAPVSAAQWSVPTTLPGSHTSAFFPQLGFTAAGGATASWRWQDGMGNGSVVGASMASSRRSGAAFGAERELPPDLVAGPQHYGSDRVLVARLQDRARDRLLVQAGDLRGRLRKPELVARGRSIRFVQLAANERGAAALGWFDDRGTSDDRVYVSLRARNGSFGRPIRLARGRIRSVSVAVGPAGHVLVAWDARGIIRTRTKGPADRRFAGADQLRSRDTFNAALRTAVARDGRAWVAWTAQFLSEGGSAGDVFVQTALRVPGAGRFRPALLLAHMPAWAIAAPVGLALDGSGAATLAWAAWDGGPTHQPGVTTIQAARVSTSGAVDISELGRFAMVELRDSAGVAVNRAGDAIVVWTQSIDPMTNAARLHAAGRPAGAAGWGAPELISAGFQAMAPVAAYPPAGPPSVLFGARPSGALSQTRMQVATRRE